MGTQFWQQSFRGTTTPLIVTLLVEFEYVTSRYFSGVKEFSIFGSLTNCVCHFSTQYLFPFPTLIFIINYLSAEYWLILAYKWIQTVSSERILIHNAHIWSENIKLSEVLNLSDFPLKLCAILPANREKCLDFDLIVEIFICSTWYFVHILFILSIFLHQ